MRSTQFTPNPEVLEYQSWNITPKMEKVFSNYYKELHEHLREYQDAKWWRASRTKRLVPNNKLYYTYGNNIEGYEPYGLEIVPQSISRYAKDGLKGDDLVVIWFSEYQFVAITYEDFDSIYNKALDLVWDNDEVRVDVIMMEKIGEIVEEVYVGKEDFFIGELN